MISDLVRRYIAGPIATVARRLPFEPVVIAGLAIQFLLLIQDQLKGGADLETALTAGIIALGTWIVRQNVWPVKAIDASTQTPVESLGEPITGLEF